MDTMSICVLDTIAWDSQEAACRQRASQIRRSQNVSDDQHTLLPKKLPVRPNLQLALTGHVTSILFHFLSSSLSSSMRVSAVLVFLALLQNIAADEEVKPRRGGAAGPVVKGETEASRRAMETRRRVQRARGSTRKAKRTRGFPRPTNH